MKASALDSNLQALSAGTPPIRHTMHIYICTSGTFQVNYKKYILKIMYGRGTARIRYAVNYKAIYVLKITYFQTHILKVDCLAFDMQNMLIILENIFKSSLKYKRTVNLTAKIYIF